MICVCDICGECVKCTNPNPNLFCTECTTLFPFNHFKHDDDFKINLYSYFHLNNDALIERLKHNKINPFELNDIDIFNDDNLFLSTNSDNTPKLNKCKYILVTNSMTISIRATLFHYYILIQEVYQNI